MCILQKRERMEKMDNVQLENKSVIKLVLVTLQWKKGDENNTYNSNEAATNPDEGHIDTSCLINYALISN